MEINKRLKALDVLRGITTRISNKDKTMIMEIAQNNKVILDVFCKSI